MPRGRARLLTLAGLALLVAATLGTPGTAAGAKRVRVSANVPEVALAGERSVVRGRVRTRGRRLARRVFLQQKVGRRWAVRARSRANKRGRFALRWHAPRRQAVLQLRVVAGRTRRPLARTRPRTLAVTVTDVLHPGRVVGAPPPGQAGELRYRARRVDVRRGQFVALDVGPETPHGLLARVTSVDRRPGETRLGVEPATLPEVIPSGSFTIAPARAGRAKASATPRGFAQNLSCDASVAAQINGTVTVDVQPRLSLSWHWFRLRSAEASATVTGTAELAAALDGAASCTLARTPVASWTAPPIRFAIGPVPVVIVPQTTLSLAAGAEASGTASTSVGGSVSATAGLRVEDGNVQPIGGFDHGFTFTAPQAAVKATVSARAIPEVVFLLYGVGGPRFELITGLQLNAHPASRPWWALTAPIKLDASLVVPGFDQFTVGPVTVFEQTFPIADAGTGGGSGDPAGGPAVAAGERARIDWDTDDTDVDLHIWDDDGDHAYFSQQEEIPDGTLSIDITTGFGPEIFTDHLVPSSRRFTYGLCYYDDNDHGPTNVTVRIIDPDGSIRTSVHNLAFAKDSVLLGSSPPGGGYEPVDDWC